MQIYFNNDFIEADEFRLNSSNRSFRYGDGMFETILINQQIPLFIELHIQRLFSGMQLLGIEIPSDWNNNFFKNRIKSLAKINDLINARCRLTVWRDGEGFYNPVSNTPGLLIELTAYDKNEYVLNSAGIKLGVFDSMLKPLHPLSAVKTANALIYVLAAKYAAEQYYDDVVVLNQEGRIADTINSNLIIFKDSQLFTPAGNEGGVNGVMKKVIFGLCRLEGIIIHEKPLEIDELVSADEIFLTNVITGIMWIGEFRNKKYDNKFSTDLVYILNEAIRNNTLVSP